MAQRTKNKKINIAGQKYKIHEDVYKYLENIANVLQMHEIAMLGWVKNCKYKEDKQYEKEFQDYILTKQNAQQTISQMIEADKKQEELKQQSEKR